MRHSIARAIDPRKMIFSRPADDHDFTGAGASSIGGALRQG